MTRPEIIELSNQLTERKGERVLNLQSLYRFVLQDIAKRQRFWWRRVFATLPIVANTKTYDISALITDTLFEEITKFTIITSPNPLQTVELTPVFDPETLIEMNVNTTQVQPSRYTMDANDYKTLRIDPSDLNYTAYLVGWGMPNPASDSTSDAVPLIPPWGHNTIVAGMNAKIFKFAYGSKNEKTLDAMAEYEQGLQDLMSKKQFDPNYRSQLILAEDAVRST